MRPQNKLDLLPLRQCARPATAIGPAFAKRDFLESLSRPARFQIVRLGKGVQILAANELALAEARLILQQAYGEQIRFDSVIVHTYLDPAREELMLPVMFLRIDAPRPHGQPLVQRLKDRGAAPEMTDIQRKRAVIRAEARLMQLLGFGRDVLELTDGSAQVLSWLLRYEADSRAAVRAPCAPARYADLALDAR